MVQLKKLKDNIRKRNKNFEYLLNFFGKYDGLFELPRQNKGVVTPWLAFPLVIKENKYFKEKIYKFILKKIIFKQEQFYWKYFAAADYEKEVYKKIKNAEKEANNVMKNGLLIGCHQGRLSRSEVYF